MKAQRNRFPVVQIATACLLLQACVPARDSYFRIDVPAARHLRTLCGGSAGPPEMVHYPFHGIYISVVPDPLFLGIHVPSGTVVQFNSDVVNISGSTEEGPVSKEIRLQLWPQEKMASYVPFAFRKLRDPYNNRLSILGPLPGASSDGTSQWYLLLGRDERQSDRMAGPPHGLLEGSIEIPPITINGQQYPGQALPLKWTSYFTILPVNC